MLETGCGKKVQNAYGYFFLKCLLGIHWNLKKMIQILVEKFEMKIKKIGRQKYINKTYGFVAS